MSRFSPLAGLFRSPTPGFPSRRVLLSAAVRASALSVRRASPVRQSELRTFCCNPTQLDARFVNVAVE